MNKKIISHHLKTAINSLNQANMLIKDSPLEDDTLHHFQNSVNIGNYRRKIERILNHYYK